MSGRSHLFVKKISKASLLTLLTVSKDRERQDRAEMDRMVSITSSVPSHQQQHTEERDNARAMKVSNGLAKLSLNQAKVN